MAVGSSQPCVPSTQASPESADRGQTRAPPRHRKCFRAAPGAIQRPCSARRGRAPRPSRRELPGASSSGVEPGPEKFPASRRAAAAPTASRPRRRRRCAMDRPQSAGRIPPGPMLPRQSLRRRADLWDYFPTRDRAGASRATLGELGQSRSFSWPCAIATRRRKLTSPRFPENRTALSGISFPRAQPSNHRNFRVVRQSVRKPELIWLWAPAS